ncbi:ZIP family metal transporter [Peribacillus butanolivorans]|uniref:ZIP family metal transporter n=1 Tax=Peribacillus butanolivorans TaxID=421767 RepID=UPI00369E22F8
MGQKKKALGTFLIIGFTLHNITEGIGIAAPLLKTSPRFRDFLLLGVIAGAPAIVGTWIGGFIFSPILGTLFLGIGAGAILQVIYVITKMLIEDHRTHKEPSVSWLNLSGFTIGLLIMYFTAFFVEFKGGLKRRPESMPLLEISTAPEYCMDLSPW